MEYLPPFSKEAEIAVLGSILLDNEVVYQAMEKLEPDDFLLKQHQEIFSAIMSLNDEDKPIDLLLLRNQLEKNGKLEGVGGVAYLATLGNAVPTTANVEEYIDIIKEKSALRKLAGVGSSMSKDAALETKDAEAVLQDAEQSIYNISQQKRAATLTHIKNALNETYEQMMLATTNKGKLQGLSTGFTALDGLTSGFSPNQLIIIAGRPGMGKTSLALNFASHVAIKENSPVAIFSLEMSSAQLAQRMVCSEACVSLQSAINGSLNDQDWDKINEAIKDLTRAPIYIDDTSGVNISGIRSKCRKMKKSETGLGMIVIDYLQLMQTPSKSESRQLAISEMTRALKNMSRELEVPILLLSQLSREPEKGTGSHRPMLSHLRESGSIEQDADIVMLLYRESVYSSDEEEQEDTTTELIIAKHRSGPTGTINLAWMGEWTKYVGIANEYE